MTGQGAVMTEWRGRRWGGGGYEGVVKGGRLVTKDVTSYGGFHSVIMRDI